MTTVVEITYRLYVGFKFSDASVELKSHEDFLDEEKCFKNYSRRREVFRAETRKKFFLRESRYREPSIDRVFSPTFVCHRSNSRRLGGKLLEFLPSRPVDSSMFNCCYPNPSYRWWKRTTTRFSRTQERVPMACTDSHLLYKFYAFLKLSVVDRGSLLKSPASKNVNQSSTVGSAGGGNILWLASERNRTVLQWRLLEETIQRILKYRMDLPVVILSKWPTWWPQTFSVEISVEIPRELFLNEFSEESSEKFWRNFWKNPMRSFWRNFWRNS